MGFWKGIVQFFQDSDGQSSMTRLICFLSFFVATDIIRSIKDDNAKVNALGVYLGAFVLQYVGGKGAEAWRSRGFADAPNINVNNPEKVNIPGTS